MAAAALLGLAGVGVGLGLLLSGGKAQAAGAPGGGGGGGAIPPANLCSQAIANLPETLRPVVLQAWSISGGAPAAMMAAGVPGQLEQQAGVLEGAALAAPAKDKPNLLAVAKCLRDRAAAIKTAAAGGGGVPPIGDTSNPGAFPAAVLIPGAMGVPVVGSPGGAKPLVDDDGVPSSWNGQQPYKGVASNPYFSWKYVVVSGDSPSLIVQRIFGADSITRRAQLIDRNPLDFYTGRILGTTGAPNTNAYNFGSLRPGDVLIYPRQWNPWIDQVGTPRKGAVPFPQPNGDTGATPAPDKPFVSPKGLT